MSGYELSATGFVCLTLLLFTVIVRRRRHVEIKFFGFRIAFGDAPPPAPPPAEPKRPKRTTKNAENEKPG